MIPPDGHRRDASEARTKSHAECPITIRQLIVVVDDDESVRESLPDLLRALGYDAEAFESPEAFLRSNAVDRADCLVLDIAMPGMRGPGLQSALSRLQYSVPIVFITAPAEHGLRDRLLNAGAVECLFKPFDDGALHDALIAALSAG